MALSTTDAAHLLRRSGFGVTEAKIKELVALGSRTAAVDRVLDVRLDPPVTLPIDPAYDPADNQYVDWWNMTTWWLERMRSSPTPIVEKLTLFWHGHFATGFDKVGEMGMMAQQHRTIRKHALGSFRDLVQAVSVDPAMLYYLDNAENVATAPQENFGRELMELFTLGVGQYTQTDVVSMTRAWTGHGVGGIGNTYQFHPSLHDGGRKVLFGKSATWDGPAALNSILTGTKANASARFITAKLFSFLAYPVAPNHPVVTSLAYTFRKSNLNIKALVRAIFLSSAFWSSTARYALVRTPIEWVVACLQATGVPTATMEPHWFLQRAGHLPFVPPDVSGWKQNEVWLSTAGMWGRSQWATYLRFHAWQAGVFAGLEGAAPSVIANEGFKRFGITNPSPTTRAAIEAWAAKTQAAYEYWIIPANLVQLLVLSPEFQLA